MEHSKAIAILRPNVEKRQKELEAAKELSESLDVMVNMEASTLKAKRDNEEGLGILRETRDAIKEAQDEWDDIEKRVIVSKRELESIKESLTLEMKNYQSKLKDENNKRDKAERERNIKISQLTEETTMWEKRRDQAKVSFERFKADLPS